MQRELDESQGQESDIEKLERLRKELGEKRAEWGQHVKRVHHGIPASTCHPCSQFKSFVAFREARIQELEVTLSG